MSQIELQPVAVLGGSQRTPTQPGSEPLQTFDSPQISRTRAAIVIGTVFGITFLNTLGSGLLTVALPRIAADINLPASLILWPASIFALTLSCTLLPLGAIADVLGNRPLFLTGCALHAALVLGCAFSRTGIQLIIFRALQGIALSFCLPTSVGIITSNFPAGKGRNIAFACFSGGNPIGYAIGLLLGGILVDSAGWRSGYYISCGLNVAIFVAAFFTVSYTETGTDKWTRLVKEIDWIGVAIASTCLATLSYAFAATTSSTSNLRKPANIAVLSIAVLLIPAFIFWVGRQERLGKPAIIPNSLWRKTEFTCVCVSVFLTWAMFNAFGLFVTLMLQEVQGVSALQTSIRFLPLVATSIIANVLCGYLVDKVSASLLLLVASLMSAASPALLALLSPKWSYWAALFPAMCLGPLSSDLMFNVANLVITGSFSPSEQALAGGVFNTVSQLGNAIGLAVTAVVASSVTSTDGGSKSTHLGSLLDGYRAAFWTCFAAAMLSCLISTVGLRNSGKVGLKRD